MTDGNFDDINERIEADEHEREIPRDPKRGLDRAVDNYKQPELIPFFEWPQNGHEALIHNKERGVVPEDRSFHLHISLDTETNTLAKVDNAGGIGGEENPTEEKIFNNYLGLDMPGEEKQEKNTAGGYGRGASTVLHLANAGFYVETLHDGTHVSVTGNLPHVGKITEDTKEMLDESGTYTLLRGLTDSIVEKMADREHIHNVVCKKFPMLVSDDDVEIVFEIDGEAEEIDGLDIEYLREEAALEIDYPEELSAVRYEGRECRVTDIELFDGRELPDDEEPPWEGMLLGNTDQNGDFEIAVKTEYKPQNCRAVSKGELFGLCNISEFCPEAEDSAHDDLSGITANKMGITDLLREISREEFKTTPDDRDVGEMARRKMNKKFASVNGFTIGSEAASNTQKSSDKKTTTGNDADDAEDDGPVFSAVVVDRADGAGDDVTVGFGVEEEFKEAAGVTNIGVREILSNDTVAEIEPQDIEPGEETEVTFTADKNGRYVITATLRNDDGEALAGATTFTTVGDAPVTAEEAHGVEFVDVIEYYEMPETCRKAVAFDNDDDDDELVIMLNGSLDLFKELTERTSDRRVQNNMEMLFYKWGLPAIKEWMTAKNDAEEFVDRRKVDDTPEDYIAETFAEMENELVQSIEGKTDIVVA